MPVIFAPRTRRHVSGLSGISNALATAYGTYRNDKDRQRVLAMEEEDRSARAADRLSRAEYRTAQMDRFKLQDARQNRADIMEDIDVQANELVDRSIPQQQEISRILEGLPPITMEDAGGLVDLQGMQIEGTGQDVNLGSPDIGAPSLEDLISQDDRKVTLEGFGSVPEREISVGDKGMEIIRERRATQGAERRKGGLKTFFDPNTNQYASVYEGEARERGLLPEAAGRVFFDRQEENRKAGGKDGSKAPKGMWKEDQYFEHINGRWTVNENVTSTVAKAKEGEEGGSPRESNQILTRYRDELGLEHGSEGFSAQFEQEYPGDFEAVMNMVEGKIPARSLGSMRKGRREYLISMASALTGREYSEAQVQAMAKTRSNFATGAEASNIRSINTAIGHLGESEKAVRDIYESFNMSSLARATAGGGQFPSLNSMMNWMATEVGSDKVVRLKGALEAAASEMAAALKGGRAAPTEKEIQAQKDIIADFSSPAQIRAYIETNAALLSGRLHALDGQYKRVFGHPPEKPLLDESAIAVAKEYGFYDALSDPSGAKYSPKYEAERTLYQNEEYGGSIEDIFSADLPSGFELD